MEDYKGHRISTRYGELYVRPLVMADLLSSNILKNKNSPIEAIGKAAFQKTVKGANGNALNEMILELLPSEDLETILKIITSEKKIGNTKHKPLYRLGSYIREEISLLGESSAGLQNSIWPKTVIGPRTSRNLGASIRNIDMHIGRMNGPKGRETTEESRQKTSRLKLAAASQKIPPAPFVTHEQRAADAAEATAERLNSLIERMEGLAMSTAQLSSTVAKGVDEFIENAQEQKDHADASIQGARTSLKWAIFAVFASAALTILQIGLDLYRDYTDGKHEQAADATQIAQLSALDNIQSALARPEETPHLSFSPALDVPRDIHLK